MNKIQHSIQLIYEHVRKSRRPAAMLSFGKDSMVMAHLIREANIEISKTDKNALQAHGFPVDVIYHRDPWFPHKNEFADSVIQSWSMAVHDWAPMTTGVKVKPDMLELVSRYNFGIREIDIPKNVCQPEDYPRRDFICGLNDWIKRPKSFLMDYPWDVVFIGHRSADVDPFDGPLPLKVDQYNGGGVRIVFPLREWTDAEVWNYIKSENIPVQRTRYNARTFNGEFADKWYNNDYTHACTACIDPRETRAEVFCPKLQRNVPNHGAEVHQLRTDAEYIQREAA